MRIEICIAKEKMTKMPNGAVDALKEELTRRISKRYDDVEVIVKATSNDGLSVTRTADKDSAKTRYDDVEVIVKATSNDGLSVTRTADKDSAKTFVQETLKDTWESADEWFVH
ncbi:DinI-like family protein [Escherichia coli]